MNTPQSFAGLFDTVRKTLPYRVDTAIVGFTEQLAERLSVLGLSRSDFAKRLGSSPAYVTKLMSGGTNFTMQSMVKVADALEADVRIEVVPRHSADVWLQLMEKLDPAPSFELAAWSERNRNRITFGEDSSFCTSEEVPQLGSQLQDAA